jgi:hypothetical protein
MRESCVCAIDATGEIVREGKDAELAEARTPLLIEQIKVEADRCRHRPVHPLFPAPKASA